MPLNQIKLLVIIIVLTVISGFSDAQGVVHVAQVWRPDGGVNWGALGRSALFFGVGIGIYMIAVRFMAEFGIGAPEIQAMIWFGVMMIGIALISRQFFQWQLLDQAVALVVVLGIGWLSLRQSS
jgi:hypothetical protein